MMMIFSSRQKWGEKTNGVVKRDGKNWISIASLLKSADAGAPFLGVVPFYFTTKEMP